MRRVCKAFGLLVGCGLLLMLLYSVISEVEHVGPRKVKIKPRYGDLRVKDQLSTTQLNYKPPNSPPSSDDSMQGRRYNQFRQCQSLKQDGSEFRSINKSQLDHIIVNDKHKVLYCYVPKVACTNLKRIFLFLTGKMNVTDPLKLKSTDVHSKLDDYLTYLSSLSPKGITYRLQKYKKVIFVRDPLVRILSAYRNKFLQKGNEYFKERYGRRIIKHFRENPSQKSLEKGHDMKFSEFVDYMLDPRVQRQGYNEHWDTYYSLCSPCHVRYNFIGKYETLDQDVDLLLKEIAADKIVELPERGKTYKALKSEDIVEKFYKDIDPEKIKMLYDIFRLDYSTFGYEMPDSLRKFVNGSL